MLLPTTTSTTLQQLALEHAGAWQAYGHVAAEVGEHGGFLAHLIRRGDPSGAAAQAPGTQAVLRLTAAREAVAQTHRALLGAIDQAFAAALVSAHPDQTRGAIATGSAQLVESLRVPDPAVELRASLRPRAQAGGGQVARTMRGVVTAGVLAEGLAAAHVLGGTVSGYTAAPAAIGAALLGLAAVGAYRHTRPQASTEAVFVQRLVGATTEAVAGRARGRWVRDVDVRRMLDHTAVIAERAEQRSKQVAGIAATLPDAVDEVVARADGASPLDAVARLRDEVERSVGTAAAARNHGLRELAGAAAPAELRHEVVTAR